MQTWMTQYNVLNKTSGEVVRAFDGQTEANEWAVAMNFHRELYIVEKFNPYKDVRRFEVIDDTGRARVYVGVDIEVSIQDNGYTMKVFVDEGGSNE